MSLKSNLVRARKIGFTKIIKIALYKSMLFVILKIEELSLCFRRKHTLPVFVSENIIEKNTAFVNKFRHYFRLNTPQTKSEIITKAQDILNGKVFLWATECNVQNNEWLIDPITKAKWSTDEFFYHSRLNIDGNSDVKFILELNKFYHLLTLAQAYYYTKDKQYVSKINVALQNWIKTIKYQRSVIWRIMLDLAQRNINLIYVSLLCYDDELFQKETLPIILGILKDNEKQMRKYSSPRWHKLHYGTNHDIGEMVGLIVTQLFLSQFDGKKYDKKIKKELLYLNRCLQHIVTKEGVYLEQSANYSRLVAELLVLLDVCARFIPNKAFENYDSDYLNRLSSYLKKISYNGMLPNFGDNDGAKILSLFNTKLNSAEAILAYSGKRFSNQHQNKSENLYCAESGQVAWKSQDENKIALFLRCGVHGYYPPYSGVHSHNDQLSLLLFAKGIPVFIDKGTYLYNADIKSRDIDRNTQCHNTIFVKNVEQSAFFNKWAFKEYPECQVIENNTNNNVFSFKGECSYDKILHNREVEYKQNQLLIKDFISAKSSEPQDVELNFLLAEEINPVQSENKIELFSKFDSKILTIHFPEHCLVEIKNEDYAPVFGSKRNTKKISVSFVMTDKASIETEIFFQ